MRLAANKIRRLSGERGLTVSALLRRAGVSRNAYYSLARRGSILPRTLTAVARALEVPESALLEQVPDLVAVATEICRTLPDATFENVWHTLVLLELSPRERLNRSLIRGRAASIHR